MSQTHFSKLRVLIIDDLSEVRSSIKSMLDMLGTEKIDQASDGEDALEMLRNYNYDLVCCDYELGRGKDGQQVLEEARHAHLLKASAIFIMITAAQTLEMVMGALEYQPDGYIAKPVTYDELQKRLMKILRRKGIFSDINEAIDQGATEEALENCNRLIVEKPKFAMPTYRIKGKILFDAERYDEAKELYETVIGIRPVAWARMGQAKCLHALGDSQAAKVILEELIKTNEKYVECHDLLATILMQEGDHKQAQAILQAATEQSPKAVLRQSQLSQVATKNEDWDVALKASRKAVALGKNSVHRAAENYLNLARSLQDQLVKGGYRDKTYALNEIQRALETVRRDYGADQQLHVKASLIEGLTLKNQGKEDEAQKKLQVARAIFDSLKIASAKKCVKDMGTTYIETGDTEEAENFLTEMKDKNLLTGESVKVLDQALELNADTKAKKEEARIKQKQIDEIDGFNNKAVELFEQGNLKEAVSLFKKAAANPQAGNSTYLNTIQALIMYMQKEGFKEAEGRVCISLFEKLSNINANDKSYAKLKKLKKMYKSIKK